MIVPSTFILFIPFPALLPRTPLESELAGQPLGDGRPILGVVFLGEPRKGLVFLGLAEAYLIAPASSRFHNIK
jgi:hypothetical protein